MNWRDVKKEYPNQWVKLKILDSSIIDNKKIITDMKVIDTIKDKKRVGRELGSCEDDEVVYHTSNDRIILQVKDIFGFRMVQ